MIDTEEINQMLIEILTGKPPSLRTPEADKMRVQLKKECDEIIAKGGVVDIPVEIPNLPSTKKGQQQIALDRQAAKYQSKDTPLTMEDIEQARQLKLTEIKTLGGPGSGPRPGKAQTSTEKQSAAKWMIKTRAEMASEGSVHAKIYNHILENGKHFDELDKEASKALRDTYGAKDKECYKNAQLAAITQPEKYDYYEGYGTVHLGSGQGIPLDHAWLVDKESGKVVDPTWVRSNESSTEKSDYFGLKVPSEELSSFISKYHMASPQATGYAMKQLGIPRVSVKGYEGREWRPK